MDNSVRDEIPPIKIQRVTLYFYEGDLEYDSEGKITNKLIQTMEYERNKDGDRNER